nr:GNAT family protein [uncultured Undibacterium sp.]
MFVFVIETKNLFLRDMCQEDEEAFVALSQNLKYQRFYSEQDSVPEKYKDLTQLFIRQSKEIPRTAFQLAIELKESGDLIGTVCLRLEPDNQASMGCGLARQYQGRNLMQEAAVALADFGFMELNVHRIYAETISANHAAIALCEQLGMRKEALFRENRYFKGRWWDTVVMALLRSEWKKYA